jgi:4-amino-4-deoxy-L-arabinose transferase-like glycosyltransferase
MSRRTFIVGLAAALLVGLALRAAWLTADPPNDTHGGVGVVWHDEGAWVHNARNRALWGVWRTDNWNPVFIAPVFTELESIAFRALGVGTWQARTVPAASGLIAVIALAAGLLELRSRRAALIGAWLLAANYVFVMWNRAALMESTMTMWIVVAWAAYARSARRPMWAVVAGAAVVCAWFTKASAAFFVAAMGVDIAFTLWRARRDRAAGDPGQVRAAWLTLAGMAIAGVAMLAVFVLPHWREYQFYNWQMSVTRKPVYTLAAFVSNASWLPIVSDLFTRLWLALAGGSLGALLVLGSWWDAKPAARVLVLWFAIGLLELVVHASGEERYYVPLIPALVALAAMWMDTNGHRAPEKEASSSLARWIAAPLVLLLAYLVVGSVVRLGFPPQPGLHPYHLAVRVSAALAAVIGAGLIWRWSALTRWLAGARLPPYLMAALVIIAVGWNVIEYAQWARQRLYLNYWASQEIGGLLAPGTLVHGKLANGLSLENRIRPIFIGTHFGNYDDRFERGDARYILTYQSPRLGYESGPEGRLIQDLLDHYPGHRLLATFNVDETGGPDRAALFDKFPAAHTMTTGLGLTFPPPDQTHTVAPAPVGGTRARD